MTTNEQFAALLKLDPTISIKMRARSAGKHYVNNLQNTWYVSTRLGVQQDGFFDSPPAVASATPEAAVTALWQFLTDVPPDAGIVCGVSDNKPVRWNKSTIRWETMANV